MNPSLDLSRSISICAVCSSLFQVWWFRQDIKGLQGTLRRGAYFRLYLYVKKSVTLGTARAIHDKWQMTFEEAARKRSTYPLLLFLVFSPQNRDTQTVSERLGAILAKKSWDKEEKERVIFFGKKSLILKVAQPTDNFFFLRYVHGHPSASNDPSNTNLTTWNGPYRFPASSHLTFVSPPSCRTQNGKVKNIPQSIESFQKGKGRRFWN